MRKFKRKLILQNIEWAYQRGEKEKIGELFRKYDLVRLFVHQGEFIIKKRIYYLNIVAELMDEGYINEDYFRNIKRLLLKRKKLENINFIRVFRHLQHLYIDDNKIKDLSPLSYCHDLNTLHCKNNNIEDLTPLENLTNLKYLDIERNHISSLEPLKYNKHLLRIFASDNPIDNIDVVENFPYLSKLNIARTNVHYIYPIKETNVDKIKMDEINEENKEIMNDMNLEKTPLSDNTYVKSSYLQ